MTLLIKTLLIMTILVGLNMGNITDNDILILLVMTLLKTVNKMQM
jgi:hypothetical protein